MRKSHRFLDVRRELSPRGCIALFRSLLKGWELFDEIHWRNAMKCYRLDLQKKLASYADGTLPAAAAQSVEDHLANCKYCCERLEEVREGDRLASTLPLETVPDSTWKAIEDAISSQPVIHASHHRHWIPAVIAA